MYLLCLGKVGNSAGRPPTKQSFVFGGVVVHDFFKVTPRLFEDKLGVFSVSVSRFRRTNFFKSTIVFVLEDVLELTV